MSRIAFQEYAPGEVIRHGASAYIVEERIAHSKFGVTFACRDHWGYPRILWVLWPFSRLYANVRETWARQAAELQRIQHPNLVHLHDSFENNGCFHLVLERCDYRLDRYIVSPAWDGSRWFQAIARPVLCALEHIHTAGYTHKNLHPQNIFCTLQLERLHPDAVFSGAIKLGDLEVNTLLGNVDVLNTKLRRWLVSPEYLNPSEYGPMDHRMDIYQAGLLFLWVLLGRILRYSFEEISTGLPARTAERLESGYGQVVARALQLKVADRFQSAAEFWRSIGSWQAAAEPARSLELTAVDEGS
jgi:serine/threonine protein kinase